jgi:hypothetical protein
MYEEFMKLEADIRRRGWRSSVKGVKISDRAKQHLFHTTYKELCERAPTRENYPEYWRTFSDHLDWGKRWNILKTKFGGVGIYGILPRSQIPNAYIERAMTQDRLSIWADMVYTCNPDVVELSAAIEPLYMAFITQSKPPDEFDVLNSVDNYTDDVRAIDVLLGYTTST